MQQADEAVSNCEKKFMNLSTLRVNQRVIKHKIAIWKNIGLVNTISCNFSKITQDDTNHRLLIHRHYKKGIFEKNLT